MAIVRSGKLRYPTNGPHDALDPHDSAGVLAHPAMRQAIRNRARRAGESRRRPARHRAIAHRPMGDVRAGQAAPAAEHMPCAHPTRSRGPGHATVALPIGRERIGSRSGQPADRSGSGPGRYRRISAPSKWQVAGGRGWAAAGTMPTAPGPRGRAWPGPPTGGHADLEAPGAHRAGHGAHRARRIVDSGWVRHPRNPKRSPASPCGNIPRPGRPEGGPSPLGPAAVGRGVARARRPREIDARRCSRTRARGARPRVAALRPNGELIAAWPASRHWLRPAAAVPRGALPSKV